MHQHVAVLGAGGGRAGAAGQVRGRGEGPRLAGAVATRILVTIRTYASTGTLEQWAGEQRLRDGGGTGIYKKRQAAVGLAVVHIYIQLPALVVAARQHKLLVTAGCLTSILSFSDLSVTAGTKSVFTKRPLASGDFAVDIQTTGPPAVETLGRLFVAVQVHQ